MDRPRVRNLAPSFFVIVLLLGLVIQPAVAEERGREWTQFRGPNGSGVSDATGLPTDLDSEKADWAIEVPFGRSSPVLGGDLVFLTATDEAGLITLAIDRATGQERWRRTMERRHQADLHPATDASTPTPVTDGENVIAFFEEAGIVSYDAAGKQRWFLPLGPFRNFYGMASSPVLVGGMVIQLCDQAEGSFLLGVDAATGKEVWRTAREGRLESYGTPIVAQAADGTNEVLVFGSRFLDAYDPATGKLRWSSGQVGAGPVATPVLAGDVVVTAVYHHAESGWAPFQPLLDENDANGDGGLTQAEAEGTWLANHFGWLDTDASGKITATDWSRLEREVMIDDWGVQAVRLPSGDRPAEKVWSYQKNVAYIPSPVAHDGTYFMVEDSILSVLDLETGELHRRERVEGLQGKVYASPVIGDGKLYVVSLAGDIAVLAAAAEGTVLGNASFDEEIFATPALAKDGIYLRTRSKLYRFATEPPASTQSPERPTETSR